MNNQCPELNELNSLCLRGSRNLQKDFFFGLNIYHYFSDTCHLISLTCCMYLGMSVFLKILPRRRFTDPSQLHRLVPLRWFPTFLKYCTFLCPSKATVFLSVFLGLLLSLFKQQSYQLSMSIRSENRERKLWSVLLISVVCFKHTYSLPNVEKSQRIFFLKVHNK